MDERFQARYAAVSSRDARFDGWFVTAVTSTGIYCRPSCPARTPKPANVRFHASAAAAQDAGFRACKRCRPDASPGSPAWDLRADLVGRAMRLIADGVVDREGVTGLASRLGYSARHVHRQLVAEVGAGPIALARAQRAQTARTLIETTALPFTEVAFASGFASTRQFNDTVREVFATTPTQLRAGARRSVPAGPDTLVLRLAYRRPGDVEGTLAHLAARTVPGIEEVLPAGGGGPGGGTVYRRTLLLPHGPAVVGLADGGGFAQATLRLTDLRDLVSAVHRCRRLLDLDADPVAVDGHLGADRALAPLVAGAPGRRVTGAVDGTEAALRMVLGQQVSLAAGATLAARLVARCGKPLTTADGALTHTFPSAEAVAGADLAAMGMPGSRVRTLQAVARALADGDLVLDAGADRAAAEAALLALPGVGPWTAAMIALRGLHDPDAFPAGDLGLRQQAARLGLPADAAGLERAAQAWRPWRAYAAQHLWTANRSAALAA